MPQQNSRIMVLVENPFQAPNNSTPACPRTLNSCPSRRPANGCGVLSVATGCCTMCFQLPPLVLNPLFLVWRCPFESRSLAMGHADKHSSLEVGSFYAPLIAGAPACSRRRTAPRCDPLLAGHPPLDRKETLAPIASGICTFRNELAPGCTRKRIEACLAQISHSCQRCNLHHLSAKHSSLPSTKPIPFGHHEPRTSHSPVWPLKEEAMNRRGQLSSSSRSRTGPEASSDSLRSCLRP